MQYISLQTDFICLENIISIFILQIMLEIRAQYQFYCVLIHNSSIEICTCVKNLLKNTISTIIVYMSTLFL